MTSTSATADDDDYPKHISNLPYSTYSYLNTLDIILPRPYDRHDASKFWVVYIHGGAWRDPRKTKGGIYPAFNHLFPPYSQPEAAQHIAGIASLNYRLSPHPGFPPKPGDDDDAAARTARHPDHVNDIIDALRWLGSNWGVRNGGYILVGHSCGGTLALQVAMSDGEKWHRAGETVARKEDHKTPMPRAIVPVETITDIPAIISTHAQQPLYEEFVVAAFGKDQEVWKTVSPTSGSFGTEKSWKEGRLIVLAHSREDELVEWEQCDMMLNALKEQGWRERAANKDETENAGKRPEVTVVELEGKHDEVFWEKGGQLAKAIEVAVQVLASESSVSG
ncbi:MAG: hypothetical protein M1821_003533 [Bathelium mastoideum]|nr:MAG: hypothetical protein M1821_003533 [Bathelium mastoideum]KAI9682620.1 MAG: hypothetical protein M1822_006918 [Bathelium mastoideum]